MKNRPWMHNASATILRADARALPLADASVDLIVTSPPYFGLRSYTDAGQHYAGQVGDETAPADYIDALICCTREWMRVLKPCGSIFVNLGDKYAQDAERSRNGHSDTLTGANPLREGPLYMRRRTNGVARKSLIGLPWRYALRCIDELGLILRAEIIWSKPNGLPESVTDRVRRSHEQWFHFVCQPRYYSAVDEIREPTHRVGLTWAERKATSARTHAPDNGHTSGGPGMAAHPLGRLPGSVWTIPTQPLTVPAHLGVDHFAAFPTEWPRRIILGWSPAGICTECGEGRQPIMESTKITSRPGRHVKDRRVPGRHASGNQAHEGRAGDYRRERIGYICACTECTAPTRPAVVLDPFGGTGTTALVATTLGRVGISIDMSGDYCRLAQWRTTDPDQRAKAMQADVPEKVSDAQLSLLDQLREK